MTALLFSFSVLSLLICFSAFITPTLANHEGEPGVTGYNSVKDESVLEFQIKSTQQSYHERSDKYTPHTAYYYSSLTWQLQQGVRAFELMVHLPNDCPMFGANSEEECNSNSFPVYHTRIYDEYSNCATLTKCIEEIVAYMDGHGYALGGNNEYSGEPVFITIEPYTLKGWDAAMFTKLDDVIRREIEPNKLFTPLKFGAEPDDDTHPWPDWNDITLRKVSNHVVVINRARSLPDIYASYEAEVYASTVSWFYSCKVGVFEDEPELFPYCRVFEINKARRNAGTIQAYSQWALVQCKADDGLVQSILSEAEEQEQQYYFYVASDHEWTVSDNVEDRDNLRAMEQSRGLLLLHRFPLTVNMWQARAMFDVIDLNGDNELTWRELLTYTKLESRDDGRAARYVMDYMQALCPIALERFYELERLGVLIYGNVDVDVERAKKRRNAALHAGCHLIQTTWPQLRWGDRNQRKSSTSVSEDYYSVILGCEGLKNMDVLFANSYCVVTPS